MIERLDTSMAGVCCAVVAAAFDSEHKDPDRWVAHVASLIAERTDARSLAWVAVVQPEPETGAWHTRHFALTGNARPDVNGALQREALEGFPHDDFATLTGQRADPMRAVAGTRRALLADEKWFHSSYAAFRRPLGLHEFTRAIVPFFDRAEPRALILQVDLTRADAQPTDRDVALTAATAPAIARAFRQHFVFIHEHRERLTNRLTPAQRRVLPLLVEGLSEPQVAATLNRSAHTIHDHTKTIYQTLGVSNRLQLRDVWFAREQLAAHD